MKLTVSERLVLVNILPEESDYTTLKLVRKLRESLSFSEEEHKLLKFKNRYTCLECKSKIYSEDPPKCTNKTCSRFDIYMEKEGILTWDDKAANGLVKDVHMGNKAKTLVMSTLKKMSDEKKLNETYLDAYEKFVKAVEEEDAE